MESPVSVKGVTVAARRRRLKQVAFVVVGAIVLCLVGAGGYLIYRKMNDSDSSLSQPSLSARRLAGTCTLPYTPTLSTVTTPISSNAHTINLTVSTTITAPATNGPSTRHATTDSVSATPIQSIALRSTTQITTTSTEMPPAVTYQPFSMGTSQRAVLSTEIETTTIPTITSAIQTSTGDKVTSNPTPSFSIETTTGSPVDITTISSDPCLSKPSDICSNVTGLVTAFCECDIQGLWTVIQRRFDGSVDFYRNWTEYKSGFGDALSEYWLGNDAIHEITSNANYTSKIVLKDRHNVTKYALYDIFRIADEAESYRLTIGGYTGDAGDSITSNQNGQMFSTKDSDNDNKPTGHCSEIHYGGWWFGSCGDANLNGMYHTDDKMRTNGINWFEWYRMDSSTGYSLTETKMMLQLNPSL